MRIIISGIGGKMGHALYFVLSNSKTDEVVAGFDKYANGEDFTVPVFTSLSDVDVEADVIIDFSRPEATPAILEFAKARKMKAVIATTGLTPELIDAVKEASKEIPIFRSANMSLGVNLLINLSKQAARFLGKSFEIEIIEQHHDRKVDAPSGTALSIANKINEVFENKLELTFGRHSDNKLRDKEEIGIHAIRGGTIVGKHDVMFIGTDEVVTLAHEAQSRQVFAFGALRAAAFLMDKTNGLYNMDDIIGQDYSVTNVSGVQGITLVAMNDTTMDAFTEVLDILAEKKVNLDMISETLALSGKINVSFSIGDEDKNTAKMILDQLKLKHDVTCGLAKITIEGAGMEHQYGVGAKVLKILSEAGAVIKAITTSETKISCCISADKLQACVSKLTAYFDVKQ